MKILLLDIETAPTTAYVWGLWQQTVNIDRIIDSSYVLCWAAKWYGEDDIMFSSIHKTTPRQMVKQIHKLLSEADVIVHYNGKRFDIPILNREMITLGMAPPAPYKQIDLLTVARRQFKFISNKLDYVAHSLGLGKKVRHKGFELWVQCMNDEPEAWKEMETYNKQDVVLLERLYDTFKPWIKNHPNHGVYDDRRGLQCTNCGSTHYHKRGWHIAKTFKYPRFQCQACGHWFRGNRANSNEETTAMLEAQ